MTAADIADKLIDFFDSFGIERVASVWSSTDDILVEIEGTNYYVQYETQDKIFNLLEVKTLGGSYYTQPTQEWIVVASSENLLDIFKAYIVEELIEFSDDSENQEDLGYSEMFQ